MNNLKSVHSAVKVMFIFFTLYDIRRIEAGHLGGMMSLTDILQNEVIILRVVFLLFLPCFWAVVWLFLRKMCGIFRHLSQLYQNHNFLLGYSSLILSPGTFRLPSLFVSIFCTIDVIGTKILSIFQIWSTLAGYVELVGRFASIRNENA